jgi:Sulfotransferase domain/N-terminal domain of galactosyltransferase
MNSQKPRIAFCTTCKGRAHHLEVTLPRNIVDNADYENCVFVVIDYADSKVLRDYLRDKHAKDIASGKLVVYHFFGENRFRDGPPPISFHMAHAKNLAARCGILEGADMLVTQDADNFTGSGFASMLSENLLPGSLMCPNFHMIGSMQMQQTLGRGYAGRLAVWVQDFVRAGGYDEVFDTWRGEDIDLLYRLQRMGTSVKHFDTSYLKAVRHNAEVRFKEYPHAQQYESGEELQRIMSCTNSVVNFGRFGLGNLFRNFATSYVSLKPVPTRIFGIGLHRTATTSLHIAFEQLGMQSFHFRTGNEARIIWEEMNQCGKSDMLEKWYALSDLPIPMLYKQLDSSYPGSKFILTVRDEEKWIDSIARLWSYEYNPQRWTWDVYPISNRLHKALYGTADFDAEIFINRYRMHNDEVKEYFIDRPHDLLVMDIEAGQGWTRLCQFMGMDVPSVPFPHHYHTKTKGQTNVS